MIIFCDEVDIRKETKKITSPKYLTAISHRWAGNNKSWELSI